MKAKIQDAMLVIAVALVAAPGLFLTVGPIVYGLFNSLR